jgi:hypothetical protein
MKTKLSDSQIAIARGYKGTIRIVGNWTIEKSEYINNPSGQTRFTMRTWYGRSLKTSHYYSYKNQEARDQAVAEIVRQAREDTARRQAKQSALDLARTNFVNPYKIGHVFSNSWGYDQTNIDYYEVIATTDWTVTLRPIAQNSREDGFMRGVCQPVRGKYIGKEATKRIQLMDDGKPYVACKHGWMSDWDGKADNWTAYA